MTHALDHYLTLERLMLELDKQRDPMADQIRDLMDPVWHKLSDAEIAMLDARGEVDLEGLFPLRLPAPSPAEPLKPTIIDARYEEAAIGWSASDWKLAA